MVTNVLVNLVFIEKQKFHLAYKKDVGIILSLQLLIIKILKMFKAVNITYCQVNNIFCVLQNTSYIYSSFQVFLNHLQYLKT